LHLRGVGRNLAVLATVLFAFLVILGFGAAVGEQVIGFARNLPQYEDNIAAKIRSLNGVVPGAGVLERATRVFHDLGSELEGSTISRAPPGARAPGETAPVPVEIRQNEPMLLQLLRNVIGPMLLPVAEAGLVLVFVIMILLKREDLRPPVTARRRARPASHDRGDERSRRAGQQLPAGAAGGRPLLRPAGWDWAGGDRHP